ncbi:class I SAM-dependent methyltransferase [Candidatus Woesearchaeota archaeon]|nr:class I SAM-dependent methyltransferase [Candidatus Woesearchaeota archaeon]
MRKIVKEYVGITSKILPFKEPIYEFGALKVPGQEKKADLRPFFKGKEYIGTDMRKGPGVDKILNLHKLDLPKNSVGSAIVMDTLEHVEYPGKAMEEVYRVLKPGGTVIISSVMNFPIHGYPYDYYRFTPEAFRSILKPFETIIVESAGESNFPHTVVGIGVKGKLTTNQKKELKIKLTKWKKYWSSMCRNSLATLLVPYIILKPIRQMLKKIR